MNHAEETRIGGWSSNSTCTFSPISGKNIHPTQLPLSYSPKLHNLRERGSVSKFSSYGRRRGNLLTARTSFDRFSSGSYRVILDACLPRLYAPSDSQVDKMPVNDHIFRSPRLDNSVMMVVCQLRVVGVPAIARGLIRDYDLKTLKFIIFVYMIE